MKASVAFPNANESEESRAKWVAWRKDKYGSSDVATICGLNKYTTPLELWAIKTGKRNGHTENLAMKMGRAFEPVIINEWANENKEWHAKPNSDTYVSDKADWAIATPDAWLIDDNANEAVLECKFSTRFGAWEHEVPDNAHCQVLWQMGVVGVEQSFIAAAVVGNTKIASFNIKYEQQLFDTLLNEVGTFRDLVQRDLPPAPQAQDKQLVASLFNRDDSTVILKPEAHFWLGKWEESQAAKKEVQKQLKVLEDQVSQAQAELMMACGTSSSGAFQDGRIVKFKRIEVAEHVVKGHSYFRMSVK